MTTKLPVSDHQVATSRGFRRDRGERGIALISVIAVLVLLAMVATPFLLTMRDSAARGEKFLYSSQADAEATALFDTVRSHLISGLEQVERRKLAELSPTQQATAQDPAPEATPTYDVPAEFALPPGVIASFNKSEAKQHRIWDADVTDTQALFNINNCSVGVLANILGRSQVSAATPADKATIPLDRIPESFPKTDGVVRIGTECVKYKSISGTSLINCERGYMGTQAGNGPGHDLEIGDTVMLESAYQIASRPYRLRADKEGHPVWVRYTNVDQARTIGDLGVTVLPPQDFERLRPYVTAWNGNVVGDGWANPQLVRNGITAGNVVNLYVQVKNLRYFGPGTIVRITDGLSEDYAMVAKVQGNDHIVLAGNITHDYTADETRIYCLARAPININTADVSTLAICFQGLRLRGKSSYVNDRQAEDLAVFLKTWVRPAPAGSTPTPAQTAPGVFRGFEDLTHALEQARDAGKIDQELFEACLKNAMNSNDSTLGFSTVPFTFRSYDTYDVRATVSIQAAGGRELARRELRRVMEVSSTRSGTFVIESQDEFEDQILKSRDAKYMATYPVNVNAHYDGVNIPASEYQAYANNNRFPSTDRSNGVGNVQLLPAAFRTRLGGRKDNVQHFDEERIPDGFDLSEKTFQMGVDSPFDPGNSKTPSADLVDTGSIEGFGSDLEFGMKEFACSFWYRPEWDRNQGDQVIFDYGDSTAGDDTMNRVVLGYVKSFGNGGDALVLSCNGATREKRSCAVAYRFDHGSWKSKEWYHIAVHVHGAAPGMMQLWIDGNQAGEHQDVCRLTGGISGQGKTGTLQCDDSKSFPDSGVLLVRGKDGNELMEYNQNTGTGFVVSRRKARSVYDTFLDTQSISHAEGDTVELYGFTAPLLTDLKKGGATLDQTIGPWRAYRMDFEGDTLADSNGAIIAKGLATPAPGATQNPQTISLAEWDTGSKDLSVYQDLGPAGTEGIAVILTQQFRWPSGTLAFTVTQAGSDPALANQPQSNIATGGCDIVRYRVSTTQGSVDLIERGLSLRHFSGNNTDGANKSGNPVFFPSHEYGDTAADFKLQVNNNPLIGALSAFIPIGIIGAGGSNTEYLDPLDDEPQLRSNFAIKNNSDPNLNDGHAYIQIDGEWIAYDTFDTAIVNGKVAFYRDNHLDRVALAMGAFDSTMLVRNTPQTAASTGQGGGSGGTSNSEPPIATELNVETNLPPDVTVSGVINPQQPQFLSGTITDVTTLLLAQNLDFRGTINSANQTQHRIANTIPATHNGGVQILPTFLTVTGNSLESTLTQNDGAVFAYPGFNDRLTLRDVKGNDEEVRVQWGYMGWCGLTAVTNQTWSWDRPQTSEGAWTLRHWDARAFTRAIKYPGGEMPDSLLTKAKQDIVFGKKYDNSGSNGQATIDEVAFFQFNRAVKDRVDYAFLGVVPTEVADPQLATGGGSGSGSGSGTTVPPPVVFNGISSEDTEINVHLTVPDQGGRLLTYGVPIDANTYASDGGVLLIDDELIFYDEFDAATGKFSNCQRGAFGTQPKPHTYSARVIPVSAFPCSKLVAGIDTTSGSYQVEDTSDFPDDGYIRIGLSNELIGYTNWEVGRLTAPLGRLTGFDEQRKPTGDKTQSQKLQGGSIFRSRFGTIAASANAGEIVIAHPFRVYDRYAENADDPEQSYLQLSWTKHGAIWKRITWDQLPITNVQIVALVRFSGGPLWDDSKHVIRVGEEGMPTDDRRKYLYMITDPTAINLLNVEADRIEVRMGVRYANGAYDSTAEFSPDYWKETPEIRSVKVEYVAPPQVLTQE